jgi:hypothetical protein
MHFGYAVVAIRGIIFTGSQVDLVHCHQPGVIRPFDIVCGNFWKYMAVTANDLLLIYFALD